MLIDCLIILGGMNPINLALFYITSGSKALAQVTPDNTLGTENSVVNSDIDSQKLLIEGGATRGQNLFHSFKDFNVGEGQGVYFANPAGIDLILSRVTGSNPSNILDKLGVEGNADLFLLNPNGIFFGSNASLDINGSFLATTASSILFEDGTQFSATNPSIPPLLSVNVPIGLQFGNRVGSIINKSLAIGSSGFSNGLEIADGKTLTLVGGDIVVEDGFFTGSGGSIELAGIAANDRVGLQQIEKGWALDYHNTQNFRDIRFDKGSLNFGSAIFFSEGKINFRGRHIAIKGGSQIGINQKIDIILNASESVEISGSLSFPGFPIISSGLFTASINTVDAGNITINTGKLIVRDEGQIKTTVGVLSTDGMLTSTGSGQAGNLVINASKSVEIADDRSGLFASSSGFGDAGNIRINSPQLIVRDGAQISTESTGENLFEDLIATGKGGNIEVFNAELIELTNGSSISAKSQGMGDDAGDINLNTNNLIVRGGSEINVSATNDSAAGNLNISANKIELDDGQLTANTVVGDRGNIVITTDNLLLSNQSSIGTNAESTDGGNIIITTDNLIAVNNSDITANARQGIGGRVEINARGIFGIEAREEQTLESDITATSELGVQFSGDIIINTPEVDPTSGLIKLPSVPINAEALITQNPCALKNGRIADGSSFIVVGRGGLPPNADAPVINQSRIVDWVSSEDTQVSREEIEKKENSQFGVRHFSKREKIIQAQGLVKTEDGRIFLTANAPIISPQTGAIAYPYCNANR
ncbi:MAG: filamentous hemagglutinin N-terminal domain-containing protein [Xenococcaceae cyanobacterium MO_188.B32]|nr:filamentous hemagglutinin N-terminal domain-containing protein [Xenococcaceae cyanobacterium MO_188.B32]